MESKTVHQGAAVLSAIRSDRGARVFVWSVWLAMLLTAFITLVKYGRNIPLAEDWYFVAPLTGNEPDVVAWLWSQNNEHRVPLPRLILLGLLNLTGGDFRAGMVLNITMLGILSFAMIRVAQLLRGGRASFADAFFALALLHLGHWENLFWSWQFSLVLSTALACAVLLTLVARPTLASPLAAAVAGICVVLLPLCGATGLVFVPFLAAWLCYLGVRQWYACKTNGEQQWISGILIGSAAIALCLTGLYFLGYQRPSWIPPNPGLVPSLKTSAKFLTSGLGPAVRKSWKLWALVAIGILLPSNLVAILAFSRHTGYEKHRALGVLVFFASLSALTLAMGWGRAGMIAAGGRWPLRYVLLAVPIFCTAFFAWELHRPSKLRAFAQGGLLLVMCLLLPLNTMIGLEWGSWYRSGMDALEQDIVAGDAPASLADKHRDFLIHWWDKSQLAESILMLRDTDIGPFAHKSGKPDNPEGRFVSDPRQ